MLLPLSCKMGANIPVFLPVFIIIRKELSNLRME